MTEAEIRKEYLEQIQRLEAERDALAEALLTAVEALKGWSSYNKKNDAIRNIRACLAKVRP